MLDGIYRETKKNGMVQLNERIEDTGEIVS